jgi:hypothetical protein
VFGLFRIVPAALVLSGCVRVEPVKAPPSWVKNDVGVFTFYTPPDLVDFKSGGAAIDSYVREYKSTNIYLSFDYGSYSNSLSGNSDSNCTYSNSDIGGRPARLKACNQMEANKPFLFTKFTAVHFESTGSRGKRLTMDASCATEASCKDARAIFDTIRFK